MHGESGCMHGSSVGETADDILASAGDWERVRGSSISASPRVLRWDSKILDKGFCSWCRSSCFNRGFDIQPLMQACRQGMGQFWTRQGEEMEGSHSRPGAAVGRSKKSVMHPVGHVH